MERQVAEEFGLDPAHIKHNKTPWRELLEKALDALVTARLKIEELEKADVALLLREVTAWEATCNALRESHKKELREAFYAQKNGMITWEEYIARKEKP
jgi:aldehyde:ferredoxin oxidoreductase